MNSTYISRSLLIIFLLMPAFSYFRSQYRSQNVVRFLKKTSIICRAVREASTKRGITNVLSPKEEEGSRWVKRKMSLSIGFVGSQYSGLQFNNNATTSTIEAELEKALFKIGCISDSNYNNLGKIGWSRSSRTDKGVHCARMVISVKLLLNPEWLESQSYNDLVKLVNSHLPPDIRLFSCVKVNQGFRARDACNWREYEYAFPVSLLTKPTEDVLQLQKHYAKSMPSLSFVKPVNDYDFQKDWTELPKSDEEAVDRINTILLELEGTHR